MQKHNYSIIIIYQQWTMHIYHAPRYKIYVYASNSVNENFLFSTHPKNSYNTLAVTIFHVLYWGIFEWPINPPGTRTPTHARVSEVALVSRASMVSRFGGGGESIWRPQVYRMPTTTVYYILLLLYACIIHTPSVMNRVCNKKG